MMARKDDADFAQDDTLGGRISLAREAARLTMAQAARRLGVQTASWKAWECDRADPRSNRLAMMAGLLGVSPSWLLTGVGSGPVERSSDEVTDLLRELRAASAEAVSSQQRVEILLAKLEHHGRRLAAGTMSAA
ncbi:transcriptional regulator [Mesorhizobium sp. L-8-10]|uniref:helix-turn-helix domain-containing protein n=1 Tax=unclassified Mesorhizobium TaxID=325217 RepID=UPI00192809E7|nr:MULTISPECIES: helix-turn-helix transcriptional regulator [unclassified Mesorhizobium]BCH23717.1 transcriptional regulator [Mesorhizobium sp. L-8-3]BCH31445.1 transcriptional regulator [Mesorhizobium sp. L-8-10]